MRKKFIALFVGVIVITSRICFANDIDDEYIDVEQIQSEILQTSTKPVEEPNINSKAGIVLDRESKRVLYSKNAYEKRAMASTTKIMTAIIALENSRLDEEIVVCKKAANMGGSRLGLKEGDKISMNDLLYGLMLRSGNDAATQIAISVGGSYEGFAEMMNKKALQLGLINTHFVTPHGLDNPDHYTTAYELALLADYALSNEKFSQIVNSKTKTILINGIQMELHNTNELLGNLNGVNGVKTGFTNNAGRCLVTSCVRNGKSIISVVLGADTKKDRTKDSIKIIEYVYSNYSSTNLKEKIMECFNVWCDKNKIYVEKGKEKFGGAILDKIPYSNYLVKEGEEEQIEIEIQCNTYVKAPVKSNTKIGELKVMIKEEEILKINVNIQNDIDKKEPIDYLKELFKAYKLNKTL